MTAIDPVHPVLVSALVSFTDHSTLASCRCGERDQHLSPGTARPSATGDVAEGTKPQETP